MQLFFKKNLWFNEFYDTSKNTFSNRTPNVVPSEEDVKNCQNCNRKEIENNNIRRKLLKRQK